MEETPESGDADATTFGHITDTKSLGAMTGQMLKYETESIQRVAPLAGYATVRISSWAEETFERIEKNKTA